MIPLFGPGSLVGESTVTVLGLGPFAGAAIVAFRFLSQQFDTPEQTGH
jgi:hypothetical protein